MDHRRFAQSAGEQSNIIQLITGMQEIKLNNCEKQKRWQWERIQVKLFKIGVKGLALGQMQQVGSVISVILFEKCIYKKLNKVTMRRFFTWGICMCGKYILNSRPDVLW